MVSAIQKVAVSEENQSALAERIVTAGDLASLTANERVQYYMAMCDRCSLDPLSRPFDYIKTFEGGKEKIALYPNQIAAAQLRRLHKVSLKIVDRKSEDGLYIVIAQASTPDGRCVESTGAVPMTDKDGKMLSAIARCNNLKKAETQAYRRATIAICGLDFSGADEDEGIVMKSEYFDPPIDAVTLEMPVQSSRQIEEAKDISFDRNAAYKTIKTEIDRLGWTSEDCQAHCVKKYGKESARDLTDTELCGLLESLQKQKAPVPALD